ncbi:MAG: hypothetical protein V2A73_08115 [Pseudomonadota bacterium]
MQPQLSDAEVADRLRHILASEEFQPSSRDRLFDWIAEKLGAFRLWLDGLGSIELAIVVLVCLGLLAAIATHAWFVLRELMTKTSANSHRQDGTSAEDGKDQLSPDACLGQACRHAESGRLRDAARILQQALLLLLCRNRGVTWRPAVSDWEWMRILRAPSPALELTRANQRLAFGPEPPARSAFDECLHHLREIERDSPKDRK